MLMTLQEMKTLFSYDAWATNRLFDAVMAIPAEETTRDMHAGHGSIHGTLTHMIGAGRLWLSRWTTGQEIPMLLPVEVPGMPELRAAWEKTGYGFAKFLGSLTDRKLQETFVMKSSAGKTFTHILWHTMQHVADHQTYHRGQVVLMLRQLGHTPPRIGLIGFYRETAKLP
jgi:uncharacterized damage-inducible protein DinB